MYAWAIGHRRAAAGIASLVLALSAVAKPAPPVAETPGEPAPGTCERIGRRVDQAAADALELISRRAEEWRSWGAERLDHTRESAETARRRAFGEPMASRAFTISRACLGERRASGDSGFGVEWTPMLGTGHRGADAVLRMSPKGATSESAHAVVLVHGLDEPDGLWPDLAPALLLRGHVVLKFDYPNDQSPADSANMLGVALSLLASPGECGGLQIKSVDLIGHSMGGLIVRDVLTSPTWYAGDGAAPAAPGLPVVERVIMLCAPNSGSRLAFLQPISEVREQITRQVRGQRSPGDEGGWAHSFADGAGEAGADLAPTAHYIESLNSRRLPQHVAITNIIATMGIEDVADWFRDAPGLRDAVITVGTAVGDGLVPADSQAIPGVRDVVRIRGTHRGMIQRWRMFDSVRALLGDSPDETSTPAAIPVILDRLEAGARSTTDGSGDR